MNDKPEAKEVIGTRILMQTIFIPENDGHKSGVLPILIQPNIGLESDVRHLVVEILNHSLANEALLSQKTRNAHWNTNGKGFFKLHILFETQYNQLNEIVDKIAERTRILGGFAIASFKEFLGLTKLEEQPENIPDILHLLADHETIIRLLREDIRKCSEEYEDEGSIELLVRVMSLHEKMAWMLRSYIENEPVNGGSQRGRQ
ncbi:MAG: DNA starvation/stationary phase protection protein [Anaerolineaceae bacterium]|nr:DNA starvation/stationary phase protection protein [Anaerolineaceae bacterium]